MDWYLSRKYFDYSRYQVNNSYKCKNINKNPRKIAQQNIASNSKTSALEK